MKALFLVSLLLLAACGKDNSQAPQSVSAEERSISHACAFEKPVLSQLCKGFGGCKMLMMDQYSCVSEKGDVCSARVSKTSDAKDTTCKSFDWAQFESEVLGE